MEELSQINAMLQLLPQPAFRVENGVISHVNQAAAAYFLEAGQAFAPLILCGEQEYQAFAAGKLYMTVSIAGVSMGACVSRMEIGDIVTLEQSSDSPQLNALALAAKALKEPLSGAMYAAGHLAAQDDQAAQMNRRLYQMMRIINNMSDAAQYVRSQPGRMETVEICTFLEEILEKASSMAQTGGISIAYELPHQAIFTLADREMLERSIYNLLSNAIKFADPETTVRVKLTHKNKRLYISVSNTHSGSGPQGDIYNRFLREPALDDPRDGVGLGMVLIRSTATLHGGAVLVERTEDGTRITMTLQVKANTSGQVRSPILHFDYAGEHDHCLLELADVLPAQLYSPDQIK